MHEDSSRISRRRILTAAVAVPFSVARCGGASVQNTVAPTPGPTPEIGPNGWVLQASSPQSPARNRHDDIFFLDRTHGWLINVRAEVYGTQDGGASWQQLAKLAPDQFLRCVGFSSLTTGWAGNLNVTVGQIKPDYSLFETTDGGRTWSNISSRIQGVPVVGLCGMRLPAPDTIVAVGRWNGPAVFVKSTDGGRTWISRSFDGLATGMVDVFFFNALQGFAVGGLGVGSSDAEQRSSRTVILATSDGGATWQTRYMSAGIGQWAWKIHFVDEFTGYVTTEGPTPEGVVLKTVDGGLSWRPMLVETGVALEAIGFVSRDRGWAGSFPSLYETADGGVTWKSLAFGQYVNRMRVLGPDLVFACGDRVYRWTA
ncbi:MAG: YCF48-related protein [Vicinamibacteria bacterium]